MEKKGKKKTETHHVQEFHAVYDLEYERRPFPLNRGHYVNLAEEETLIDRIEKECAAHGLKKAFQKAWKHVKALDEKAYTMRNLTIYHTLVLRLYTSTDVYGAINKALWKYRPGLNEKVCSGWEATLCLIQQAVYQRNQSQVAILYRAVGGTKIGVELFDRIVKGKKTRLWFPAFTSCSIRKYVADDFIDYGSSFNVMFRIQNWHSAINLEWISPFDEKEFLLPAYSWFEVVDHRRKDGYIEVDLKMLEV